MKLSKDAIRTARQLLRLTLRNGTPDPDAARTIVSRLIADKPRHYIGILNAYQRLLRLEFAKRHAVVESARELSPEERESVTKDLEAAHGSGLTTEFRVVPELVGGMRIQLGSTVWDGSVKARLEALRTGLAA